MERKVVWFVWTQDNDGRRLFTDIFEYISIFEQYEYIAHSKKILRDLKIKMRSIYKKMLIIHALIHLFNKHFLSTYHAASQAG